jgi:hypothetical protein
VSLVGTAVQKKQVSALSTISLIFLTAARPQIFTIFFRLVSIDRVHDKYSSPMVAVRNARLLGAICGAPSDVFQIITGRLVRGDLQHLLCRTSPAAYRTHVLARMAAHEDAIC